VEEPLSRRTRRQVVIALVALISTAFVVLAIVSATGDLPKTDIRLEWGWLALSGACFLLFQPLIVEVWRRVLRDAGGPLPVPRAHAIYNGSLLTRYVPTQVLMAVTRIELAQREGVARTVSVAAFAYEFALSVGTAFAISVSFVISLDSLQGKDWRYLSLLAPVAVLGLLHPRIIDVLESKVAARFGVTSAHVTIAVRRLVPYLITYVVIWLVAGVGVYSLARGIHDVGPPGIDAISSYAIGFAAAAVAFVLPAGLGARDVATATALSASMPFSVALTASIIVRLVQTGIEILYAGTTAYWAKHAGPAIPQRVD
jgi:hypothetical protein